MILSAHSLFLVIDFLGVTAAAIGGALEARSTQGYKYDFVGVLGLGLVSALGGGISRDVLIQHGPPLAFTDVRYLVCGLLGSGLALLLGSKLHTPVRNWIVPVDAAALGLFAVSGATRALNAGLSWLPALLLGITTAVGGGALRDVFSGRSPRIFESGQLYALVALFAAGLFLLLDYAGISRTTSTCVSVVAGFLLRLGSLRLGWKTKAVR